MKKKLLEEIIAKIIIKSAKATVIMYMPTPIDSNPRKETAIAPARSYNLSVKTRDVVVLYGISYFVFIICDFTNSPNLAGRTKANPAK